MATSPTLSEPAQLLHNFLPEQLGMAGYRGEVRSLAVYGVSPYLSRDLGDFGGPLSTAPTAWEADVLPLNYARVAEVNPLRPKHYYRLDWMAQSGSLIT